MQMPQGLIKHNDMKKHEREVGRHAFLSLSLDIQRQSASHLDHYTRVATENNFD
jgi:hypothetical protein